MIGQLEPRADGRRFALAVVGRAVRRLAPRTPEHHKILVVRPDHLGDLLFLTPALRRLRRQLPAAEIVGLVGTWGVPVLERNPCLDRLIPWDFPWFDRQPRRSPLAPYQSLCGLANRLKRERFDAALQFRPDFWWGALAVRLAGVPEHLGYDVPVMRSFLTRTVPLRHELHAADENLRLVDAFVPGGGPERLEFAIFDSERERARLLLAAASENRPVVALQAGAGAPVKLWPSERLAAVGRALRETTGASVVVVGGKAEADLVAAVARGVGPETISLAGVTSLGELAAVLERCSLVLGPDSGPLHLAVAVGTPTVHLYGPADPRRFGPYGDPSRHRAVAANWPCCPCNQLEFARSDLASHRCVAEITTDEVVGVALDVLRQTARRPGSIDG